MSDLVGLIWGSDAPASAVNIVHKYVGNLRRLLEPDLPHRASGSFLVRHGNGYRFTADAETLDLIAFRRLVAEAKASLSQGRSENAVEHYARALPLCHGNVGEALADSAGATAAFAGIDREFFDAAVSAADVVLRLRRPSLVIAPLRLAARMSRYNEPVHAGLISTLAALGLRAEALSVFQEIRARLSDDFGIDPGHDLQEAHRVVLTRTVPSAETAVPQDASPGEHDGLPDAPRPVSFVHPAQLPRGLPLFVGREPELEWLTTSLGRMRADRRTGPMAVALDGMGGVGKSTLATHFAHAIADEFTDGQLYLDLRGDDREEGSPTAGDALNSLLYALGVPASHMPDTFDARMGTYRSLTAGKRFLLLLDNVRDAVQVRPLLPNSADSLVVITSRPRLAALDGAYRLRVDVPDHATARELLVRRLAGRAARGVVHTAEGSIVDEIVELCGRLPLALAILAARLIARPTLSLDGVVAELRDGDGDGNGNGNGDGDNRLGAFPGGRDIPDLRTAFSWSYRQLSAEAASSLNAQALLQPHRAPAAPPPPLPGVVPERPATCGDAVEWFASRRQVLLEVVRLAADIGYGIVPWQLATTMHGYLQWAGCFQEWESIMRAALRAARQEHDVIGEAHVLRGLAGARFSVGAHDVAGRDEVALDHSQKAVELYRIAGNRHAEISGLWEIGQMLARLGRLTESAEILERALGLAVRLVNMHVESEIQNDIAADLIQLGRTAAALERLRHTARSERVPCPSARERSTTDAAHGERGDQQTIRFRVRNDGVLPGVPP
ncbi:BTAD domain-containing putative transcriptional regulator [Nonomuraea fuscirosea]|uniref:AfsR/SARP family transcriptional regulator n=1 Tax=Nonomuraea fuscirosea TaxID=1291556 RepID=UPI0034446E58